MRVILGFMIALALALPAAAQPTIDGTLAGDATYVNRAVQTIETGFGDNLSEWNAAYSSIDGSTLSLMFTGNVENNFNKLELFLDTEAGGSNVLDAFGNDGSDAMDGMTFDTAFAPEYHFIFRRGNAGTDIFDVDMARLPSGNGGGGSLIIDGATSGKDIFGGTQEGSAAGIGGTSLAVAYDNSNVAGIGGMTGDAADQAAALAVQTGLELAIDLADIGNPINLGDVKVMLLQNNQGHDFLSNQSLAGLPVGFGNLGTSSAADFSSYSGNQFFHIPEPGTLGLGALALMGMAIASLRRKWG